MPNAKPYRPVETSTARQASRQAEMVLNSQASSSAIQPQENGSAMKLIGAVSHEMRNPLNGILGMAHLLNETQLDSAQRNYLEGIATSGEVLLALVNDLLDLTALENGAIEPTPTPTDLGHLVNQCIELAAPRAHAKGLAIGSTIDPAFGTWQGDPCHVDIDGGRVRQVLTNLLSNAIKFTDSGGVGLSLKLASAGELGGLDTYAPTATAADRTHLVFDVRDTGHGIAPDDQMRVFEPFGRTKSAQVGAIEGTGLGLPLSRGLARAMGGDLMLLTSARGLGTTMRFTLPLAAPFKPVRDSSDHPLADQRVLLVVEPTVAVSPETDMLAATLEDLGAEVRTLSAADALNGAPENVDHVLIDAAFDHAMLWSRLCLPQVGLRPVILLRPDDRHMLADLRDAGFSGYLIRPVRQASLVAMLTHRFDADGSEPFLADPADIQVSDTSAPRQRILIGEDNPVNARLAKAALERAGHTVTLVGDGARVIALTTAQDKATEPFDLVLLDLAMPVLDGFAAARQLREAGFAGRVIAYSGNTDPELPSQLKKAGFDGFAQKPLVPSALQALVSGEQSN
jgi:signal transduction histidine kinase/CheY-like chemotaxis protein